MLAALLLASTAFAADPVIGVAWVPFSRGDLVAVQDGGWTTGTGVGEFDGLVRPALTFHGGVAWGRETALLDLGVARRTTTTWLGDGYSQVHVGGVRVGGAWRHDLAETGGARAWGEVGAWGVIPSARDVSDAYTDAEQEDADESAAEIRKSIGGVGGRLGPGFGVRIGEAATVGARLQILLFRGQRLTEESLSISTAVWGEAALLFEARL